MYFISSSIDTTCRNQLNLKLHTRYKLRWKYIYIVWQNYPTLTPDLLDISCDTWPDTTLIYTTITLHFITLVLAVGTTFSWNLLRCNKIITRFHHIHSMKYFIYLFGIQFTLFCFLLLDILKPNSVTGEMVREILDHTRFLSNAFVDIWNICISLQNCNISLHLQLMAMSPTTQVIPLFLMF